MSATERILNKLIPITLFNRGKASQIFNRLQHEKELIVIKNNVPSAVILSPDEYERMVEIEENYHLLIEAQSRMTPENMEAAISFDRVLTDLGLSSEAIENAEDIDIL